MQKRNKICIHVNTEDRLGGGGGREGARIGGEGGKRGWGGGEREGARIGGEGGKRRLGGEREQKFGEERGKEREEGD